IVSVRAMIKLTSASQVSRPKITSLSPPRMAVIASISMHSRRFGLDARLSAGEPRRPGDLRMADAEKWDWVSGMLEWAKTIASAFLAYVAFTTVAFAQYEIPSESMVPHIEVGDRVT